MTSEKNSTTTNKKFSTYVCQHKLFKQLGCTRIRGTRCRVVLTQEMQPIGQFLLSFFNKLFIVIPKEFLGWQRRTAISFTRELQTTLGGTHIRTQCISLSLFKEIPPACSYLIVKVLKLMVPMPHNKHAVCYLDLHKVDGRLAPVMTDIVVAHDPNKFRSAIVVRSTHGD